MPLLDTITLKKGGKGEKTVPIGQVHVPDLWHLALAQPDERSKEAILEVWHLAHDLLSALHNDGSRH